MAALLGTAIVGASTAGAQPAAPEDWRIVASEHFTIYTDAEPERGIELARRLELFRAVFARLAPEVELRSPGRTRIFAFRDAASYAPYKKGAERGVVRILGQFLSHRDGTDITLDAGRGLSDALGVVYHEYAHFLVRHNFPRVPLWFNEGLAEYYSTFTSDAEAVYLGLPVGRHLDWLRRGGRFSLGEVLGATRRSAADHDAEQAGQLYAVSWALVHYLLSGGDEGAARMADLLVLLDAGTEPEDALAEVFGVGVAELEERLRGYLRAGEFPRARIPADRFEPAARPAVAAAEPAVLLSELGDLLARIGRTEEAERHLLLALDHDPAHAGALAGLAFVRDLQQRSADAAALFQEALRAGGLDALGLVRYGRHLIGAALSGADGAEAVARRGAAARAALAEAARLAPASAEAWAMLGQAHLLPGGDPSAGLKALERAREADPARADVVFHAVQLHLLRGEIERAHELVATDLEDLAEPELAARARRDVERAALLAAARDAFAAGDAEEGLRLLDRALELATDPALRSRLAAEREALARRFSGR